MIFSKYDLKKRTCFLTVCWLELQPKYRLYSDSIYFSVYVLRDLYLYSYDKQEDGMHDFEQTLVYTIFCNNCEDEQ